MLDSTSFLNTDASLRWELGDEVGIAGQVLLDTTAGALDEEVEARRARD
jgi:hypothetical protein